MYNVHLLFWMCWLFILGSHCLHLLQNMVMWRTSTTGNFSQLLDLFLPFFHFMFLYFVLCLWYWIKTCYQTAVTHSMKIPHLQMTQHISLHLVLLCIKQCPMATRMLCGWCKYYLLFCFFFSEHFCHISIKWHMMLGS